MSKTFFKNTLFLIEAVAVSTLLSVLEIYCMLLFLVIYCMILFLVMVVLDHAISLLISS